MKCTSALAAILLITIGCDAQEGDALRAKSRAETAAALKANRSAAATFLDQSASESARLAAVKDVAVLIDRGDVASALELVRDEGQPVAIRVRALELTASGVGRDDELLTELLALLASKDAPPPLRREAAKTCHLLLVAGGTLVARHEDIIATLRQVAQDPDAELRGIALSTLAAEGDSVAQEMLASDLRDPNTQLVPPEEAVALLALHPSGNTLPALREVLAKPPNAAAQEEAARALGGDVTSHGELQKVIRDVNATDSLRFAAVGALNANAPEKILAAAVPLLNDEGAGDDVRIYAIKTVQAYQQTRSQLETAGPLSAEEKAFEAAVKKLQTKAKSAAVREAAKTYTKK